MFFRYRRILQAGLSALDLLIVALVILLTNTSHPVSDWDSLLGPIGLIEDSVSISEEATRFPVLGSVLVALALWCFCAVRFDLYRSRRTDSLLGEILVLGEAWVLIVAVSYAAPELFNLQSPVCVRSSFLVGWTTMAVLRGSLRLVLSRLRVRGRNSRSILFVGWSATAERLVHSVRANPAYGLRCRGVVTMAGENPPANAKIHELGSLDSLERILADLQPQRVILSPPPGATIEDVSKAFKVCDEAGLPCSYAATFDGANLKASPEQFAGLPLMSFVPEQFGGVTADGKRVFDLISSAIALFLLAPLFLMIGLIIKLQDGGPVFFRQRRVGRFGDPFWCLKFRTMVPDAEAKKAELLALNEESGPAFKMKKDPRVTRIGYWLRKFSIDELPQLINVFLGDMSIVGPRPPTPDEVKQYEWAWRRRLSVRPGLTCVWQIWGRNRVEFREWMEMDLFYIDNWSLWKDLRLILRTVFVVARGTGS